MLRFLKKIFKKRGKLALELAESEILVGLAKKGFENLSAEEQREFLKLAAKDFSGKFRGLIERLAHE